MTLSTQTSAGGADPLEIRADRRASLVIGLGSVLIALCLYGTFAVPGISIGSLGCAPIVLIILGIWSKTNTYIKFEADYLETRLAPIRGWHAILYSEVTQCVMEKRRVTVFYRKHGASIDNKPTRVKISLSELRDADRAKCLDAFRSRLPAAVVESGIA